MDVLNNDSVLSGIEQLRALMSEAAHSPIIDELGLNIIEIDEGRIVFLCTPSQKYYDSMGAINKEYAATILDIACRSAIHTKRKKAQAHTTTEFKAVFHDRLKGKAGRIRAEGLVTSTRLRAAYSKAKLTSEGGHLLASATSRLRIYDLN